jgi:hypothetical protein
MSPRSRPGLSISLPDDENETELFLYRGFKTMNLNTSLFYAFVGGHWREIILLALVIIQSIGLYVLAVRQQRQGFSSPCETTRAHSYGQVLYCELMFLKFFV